MKTYYLKYRRDTENIDPKMIRTKIADYVCNQSALFAELKTQDL